MHRCRRNTHNKDVKWTMHSPILKSHQVYYPLVFEIFRRVVLQLQSSYLTAPGTSPRFCFTDFSFGQPCTRNPAVNFADFYVAVKSRTVQCILKGGRIFFKESLPDSIPCFFMFFLLCNIVFVIQFSLITLFSLHVFCTNKLIYYFSRRNTVRIIHLNAIRRVSLFGFCRATCCWCPQHEHNVVTIRVRFKIFHWWTFSTNFTDSKFRDHICFILNRMNNCSSILKTKSKTSSFIDLHRTPTYGPSNCLYSERPINAKTLLLLYNHLLH